MTLQNLDNIVNEINKLAVRLGYKQVQQPETPTLKMYEVKITFPFLAESKEDMLQKIRPYLYPHLDENILDAPEIVREIPPDEAQEYTAVNADEVNVG